MSDAEPNRKWFQFSLRLLLLVVVAFAQMGCDHNRGMYGGNIHYDRVQREVIGLKLGYAANRTGTDYFKRGVLVQLEPGIRGGEASIGYGEMNKDPIVGPSVLQFSSWTAKVCILRTWGDEPQVGVEPNQTYLGIGVDVSIFLVYVTASAYVHVRGDDDDHDVIGSVGVGLGW